MLLSTLFGLAACILSVTGRAVFRRSATKEATISYRSNTYQRNQYNPRSRPATKVSALRRRGSALPRCSEFQRIDTCDCDLSTQEVTFGNRCQAQCKSDETRVNYIDSQGRDNSKCVGKCAEFQRTDTCKCDLSTQEVTFGDRCQAKCKSDETRVNYIDSQGRDNSKCVAASCSEFQTTDTCQCDLSTQVVTFGNRCQAKCQTGETRVNYIDSQGRDNSKCLGSCSEFQTTDTCQCDLSTQVVTFGNRCQAKCQTGETRVNYIDSQGRDNSRCVTGPITQEQPITNKPILDFPVLTPICSKTANQVLDVTQNVCKCADGFTNLNSISSSILFCVKLVAL